jgi:hypothetical protein
MGGRDYCLRIGMTLTRTHVIGFFITKSNHVLAINSEVDERNPPELHVMNKALAKIPNARLLLIPGSEQTAGHGTTGQAKWWKNEVGALLQTAPRLS